MTLNTVVPWFMTTEWLLVTQIACMEREMQIPSAKVVDIHTLKSTYVVYSPEGLVEPSSTERLILQ